MSAVIIILPTVPVERAGDEVWRKQAVKESREMLAWIAGRKPAPSQPFVVVDNGKKPR